MTDTDDAKRRAGEAAAALVQTDMCLGLGTGSTTLFALDAIGRRIREEGLRIRGIATSFQAERAARRYGIPLTSFEEVARLDLAIDGADEVDDDLNLIKGRGGAHTREKVIAARADRFVVLIDPSKRVSRLGTEFPVPVEVLPMAAAAVMRDLKKMGATPELREGGRKDGPVVTDQGFWLVDARFDGIDDPAGLDRAVRSIPGVLDHGLFIGMATSVLVGSAEGVEELRPLKR
jgi:ribose 5-phosphate isomerase A